MLKNKNKVQTPSPDRKTASTRIYVDKPIYKYRHTSTININIYICKEYVYLLPYIYAQYICKRRHYCRRSGRHGARRRGAWRYYCNACHTEPLTTDLAPERADAPDTRLLTYCFCPFQQKDDTRSLVFPIISLTMLRKNQTGCYHGFLGKTRKKMGARAAGLITHICSHF